MAQMCLVKIVGFDYQGEGEAPFIPQLRLRKVDRKARMALKGFSTQRRKGAKEDLRKPKALLCAFAPLREKTWLVYLRYAQ
jgi:hypothetical protein